MRHRIIRALVIPVLALAAGAAQAQKRVSRWDGVYTDAQAECERQNPTDFSGRNRVPCVEAYVTSHKVAEQPINPDLYKFDFDSPVWSPDLAGISLVLTGLFTLLGGFALLLQTWLKGRLI